MKKALMTLIMATFMVASVTALSGFYSTDSRIVPGVLKLEYTDSEYIEYCVDKVYEDDTRDPYPNLPVVVDRVCMDHNNKVGCQEGTDTMNPPQFSIATVDTMTDENGCATLHVQTVDAYGGSFYYRINGMEEGKALTLETGASYIPEFTEIGAAAVLLGAAVFIFLKRK
jgi:hypothetical protein